MIMIYLLSFLFILGLFAAISIPLVIISEKRKRRELEKVFSGRQELEERDFYERYFREKEIPFYVVQKIRVILEEVLDADLSRLSAKDDFSKNLNFFWQEDSLADVEIIERIEEEFGIAFQQKDFESLNPFTVEQIVEITWTKILEKSQ